MMNLLHAIQTLLGQHAQAQPQAKPQTQPPTGPQHILLTSTPEALQGVHSPVQITNAANQSKLPVLAYRGLGPNNPRPIQNAVSQAGYLRFQQLLNAAPTPANQGGALAPPMVNVAWSPTPVPYAQSLNGPPK